MNWSDSAWQTFIFLCSFSRLTSSSKVMLFSFCRHLVYDQNQWGLKLSTAIYKMQLLYTTHSKTPVVCMLRHNLCHLPPERYWSFLCECFTKGSLECKLKEICGYWGRSIIWLIMTNLLNLTSCCIFVVIWPQNLRVFFSSSYNFTAVELCLCFGMPVLFLALSTMWMSKTESLMGYLLNLSQRVLVWMESSHLISLWPWPPVLCLCQLYTMEQVIQFRSHWFLG